MRRHIIGRCCRAVDAETLFRLCTVTFVHLRPRPLSSLSTSPSSPKNDPNPQIYVKTKITYYRQFSDAAKSIMIDADDRRQKLFLEYFGQPAAFWTSGENLRDFITKVVASRGASIPEGIYELDPTIIESHGGRTLLQLFGVNMIEIAKTAYPEIAWLPWRFNRLPPGFWSSKENRLSYLHWLGSQLGYTHKDDWYKIQASDFRNHYGYSLMKRYNYSPQNTIAENFEDYDFKPWLFRSVPFGYFEKRENRKLYLDWLLKVCGLSSLKELRVHHFLDNSGSGVLMQRYGGSPQAFIDSLDETPQNKKPQGGMLRGPAPRNHWNSMENQRAFMEAVRQELKYPPGDFERFYSLTSRKVGELGGHGLLKKYGYSVFKVLESVFPEYDWLPWKFKQAPKFVLEDASIIKKAIKIAEKKLSIGEPNEWHRVSMDVLREIDEGKVFDYNGGILKTLTKVYPDINWLDRTRK